MCALFCHSLTLIYWAGSPARSVRHKMQQPKQRNLATDMPKAAHCSWRNHSIDSVKCSVDKLFSILHSVWGDGLLAVVVVGIVMKTFFSVLYSVWGDGQLASVDVGIVMKTLLLIFLIDYKVKSVSYLQLMCLFGNNYQLIARSALILSHFILRARLSLCEL